MIRCFQYDKQFSEFDPKSRYIVQIKEELIDIDTKQNRLSRFVTIVERAQQSLADLIKIWSDQQLSDQRREWFSPQKITLYMFQTIRIMNYLHKRGVYYGDMKPGNLLVFRD